MDKNAYKYEIILYWSKEDNCFVAEIPELPGCISHGKTEVETIENIRIAQKLWLGTANEFGDPVPEPKGRLIFV
ncbi:MAG: type II toxin-antitoxin system HicB family antitoxin [Bacteroidetes bacterium]|nr:MAG: type II toxin-antitoxin system HicB family antitoxin [Bacteroidota bacterium]